MLIGIATVFAAAGAAQPFEAAPAAQQYTHVVPQFLPPLLPLQQLGLGESDILCGCEDFQRRANFDATDIRRLCPHLQCDLLNKFRCELPTVFVALLQSAELLSYRHVKLADIGTHQLAVAVADDSIVHVFARKPKLLDPGRMTGPYARYAYDLALREWTPSEPLQSEYLLQIIQTWVDLECQ